MMILAWLNIAVGLVVSAVVLGVVPTVDRLAGLTTPASVAPPVGMGIGGSVMGLISRFLWVLLAVGVTGIVAGIGTVHSARWARSACTVASVLNCLMLDPIHLALGVYGLVVLLNKAAATAPEQVGSQSDNCSGPATTRAVGPANGSAEGPGETTESDQ
jgi:hypothetical protein